jgi:transposase-like protein
MSNKRKTSSYTDEFRQSSAKLAIESDQPVSKTAKDLGINAMTLHGWVAKYHPRNNQSEDLSSPTIDPQAELKLLKKKLARVTMERDILKKAAAYFASQAL